MIDEVANRAAIRDLCDLYHAAVNFRDWAILPAIFTPDAVWSARPPIGLRFEGLSAVTDGIRTSVERQEILVQTSSGIVVDFDGADAATVRSTLVEFGREPGKDRWSAVAVFEDRVVKADNRWRFAARTVHLRHLGAFPISKELPAT